MAHRGSGAPLLVQLVMAHHSHGAPLVVLKKLKKITNGAPTHGAPLVYSSGAPHVWCAISVHIIYSPFPSSEPIVPILASITSLAQSGSTATSKMKMVLW